jgi:hypothetical protein
VAFIFLQDEVGPLSRRQNIFVQVSQVDARPDRRCGFDRLLVGQTRITMKIRFWIAECGSAQSEEAIHVPGFQDLLVGVKIDRKIEEIRDEGNRLAILRQATGLEHVQPFDDKYVRPVHLDRLIRHDVIEQVRVDRCSCRTPTSLDVGKEAQQRRQIITFRETLLFHQAFAFENGVRIKKAICCDQIDRGHIRPARQQGLQDTRRGRLANRDGACDADDVWHFGILGSEEALLCPEKPLRGRHIH